MSEYEIVRSILDSIPYPVEFCDLDNVVRYLNKPAREKRGASLLGKSIFDCHNSASVEKIKAGLEHFKSGGGEIYVGLNRGGDERLYMNPVRNSAGELIGYFERHEKNPR